MIRFKQIITAEYGRKAGSGSSYTLFALGEDGLIYKSVPQKDQLQHQGWLQISADVLGADFQDRRRQERAVRKIEGVAGENMAEAVRLDSSRLVRAPFNREQVEAINRYQTSAGLAGGRPFVCEHRNDNRHPRNESILLATPDGLVCNYCDFTQKWVHELMIYPAAQNRTNNPQTQLGQTEREREGEREQRERSQAAGSSSNR